MTNINRATAPEPTEGREFVFPEFEEKFLQNGSRVVYHQKPGLPITVVTFMVEAGSKYDPEGGEGLAYLTAQLLDEGAGELDSLALSALLESKGLNLSVSASLDHFNVRISGLSDNLDLMMKIVSDVVYDPHLKLEDFERERDRVRNTIKQFKQHPQAMAWVLLDKIVQGRPNAYAHSFATEESIEEITLSDVTFFHAERIEPTKPAFTVVSDLGYEDVEKALNTHFTGKMGIHQPEKVDTTFQYRDLRFFILDRKDSPQTEIQGGFPMECLELNRVDQAFKLVNSLYGGHFNSRLMKNLREEKGFTYGVSSATEMMRESGVFYLNTSVDTPNTGPALIEMLKEMNDVRKKISEEELEFSRNQLIRGMGFSFETYDMISALLGKIVARDLKLDHFEKVKNELGLVTLEDAVTAANRYLLMENLQFVLVGDKEGIINSMPQPLLRGVVEINDRGMVLVREQ